jgi:hypothetical protein
MVRRAFMLPFLGFLIVALVVVGFAAPAHAYGKANWQVTFSATATAPGTDQGFGFWGWCRLTLLAAKDGSAPARHPARRR